MSWVESDEDDTAELAAVVLDRWEVVRRKGERLETLYETFQNGGRNWYRCLACDNRNVKWLCEQEGKHIRFLSDMQIHITEEHSDKLDEVVSVMRKEVLTRKRANHGVEDPVRWEAYYRTNCKLRRPV